MTKLSPLQSTLLFAAFFAALGACHLWQTRSIGVTEMTYSSPLVPQGFSGMRIAQVSDLHNTEFGRGQSTLLRKLQHAKPDIIVITGDLIDRRHPRVETAMAFVEGAVAVAPVYYVPGNHEAWSDHYPQLRQALTGAGVTVLEDRACALVRGDDRILLSGVRDRSFLQRQGFSAEARRAFVENLGRAVPKQEDTLRVLLAHRPELAALYADAGADLVFSGHAHGGQVRLPLIGALVVPDQGFPPKYTEGMYRLGDTAMVVSRGLGCSVIPIRTFNRPELVVVTLRSP